MKNLFTIVILVIIIIPSKIFSQWISYNVQTNPDLFDLSSPDQQTCYVCGYGNAMYKTTNGGINWIDISFAGTAQNLQAIHFFNSFTGIVASTNHMLYRTTNGGINWGSGTDLGFQINKLFFRDNLNGYAGAYNKLSVTTDGGITWTPKNTNIDGTVFFINVNTGWLSNYLGAGSSEIKKTTDAGTTWSNQYTTFDFKILYDINFINESTGYASGYRHTILKTTNGGINWAEQFTVDGASGLYSIYFVNPNTGWTSVDYSYGTNTYYNINGGINWIPSNQIISGGRVHFLKLYGATNG